MHTLELNIAIITEMKNVLYLIPGCLNNLLRNVLSKYRKKNVSAIFYFALPPCTVDPFSYIFYPPYIKSFYSKVACKIACI